MQKQAVTLGSKKQGRKKPGKKVTTNKVQRKKNPISNTQIFILTRSPFERVEYCLLCQNAEIHVFFKFSTLLHRFPVQIDLNSIFVCKIAQESKLRLLQNACSIFSNRLFSAQIKTIKQIAVSARIRSISLRF